jgi:hypothetical protein
VQAEQQAEPQQGAQPLAVQLQTSREAARGIPLILEAVLLVFMGLVFHPPVLLVLELAAQGMVFFLVAH